VRAHGVEVDVVGRDDLPIVAQVPPLRRVPPRAVPLDRRRGVLGDEVVASAEHGPQGGPREVRQEERSCEVRQLLVGVRGPTH
jgi:hypothetical protein